MKIIGGTYTEICFEPIWENIFGSGLRACALFLYERPNKSITYYTSADQLEIDAYLRNFEYQYSNFQVNVFHIPKSPEFHYDYPLRTPSIVPRVDTIIKNSINLDEPTSNILFYGMIETNVTVNGDMVVYDPQSPVNPKSFSSTNSRANRLAVIINQSEAKLISKADSIFEIRNWFFENENCELLIIKSGAKGAFLFQSKTDQGTLIPVYETKNVWSIGSGDVFSATFARYWFEGESAVKSALNASKATALYCNSKNLNVLSQIKDFQFKELKIDKKPYQQIYLAGPFFTMSQRWLINESWVSLKKMGLNVFSPFHDVGHGSARDVVNKDLEGLDSSKVIFAIVDGLDSGTLFEIGYAICQKKSVIVFVQNESEESLKMLEGTNCKIETDFTTALYKVYWELGK